MNTEITTPTFRNEESALEMANIAVITAVAHHFEKVLSDHVLDAIRNDPLGTTSRELRAALRTTTAEDREAILSEAKSHACDHLGEDEAEADIPTKEELANALNCVIESAKASADDDAREETDLD